MTSDSHEQPGNRIRSWRIDSGDGLARNFASVVVLPSGSSIVPANDRALLVMQLCLGSLQTPGELAVWFPADIRRSASPSRGLRRTTSSPAGALILSGTSGRRMPWPPGRMAIPSNGDEQSGHDAQKFNTCRSLGLKPSRKSVAPEGARVLLFNSPAPGDKPQEWQARDDNRKCRSFDSARSGLCSG